MLTLETSASLHESLPYSKLNIAILHGMAIAGHKDVLSVLAK